jgi:hypothetical protein
VTVVRFTGTAGSFERIIDFGIASASTNNLFLISRSGATSEIYAQIFNGNVEIATITTTGGRIVQNSWLTVVYTYRTSTNGVVLSVNGFGADFTANPSAIITDRTLSASYMGRS